MLFFLIISSSSLVLICFLNFQFLLHSLFHNTLSVQSWLSSLFCYFNLVLTVLDAFGESPNTAKYFWRMLKSYFNECLWFEVICLFVYLNNDSGIEVGTHSSWCQHRLGQLMDLMAFA